MFSFLGNNKDGIRTWVSWLSSWVWHEYWQLYSLQCGALGCPVWSPICLGERHPQVGSGMWFYKCPCQHLSWSKRKDWSLVFSHSYREGNRCADFLANWSLSQGLGIHIVETHSRDLARIVLDDVLGPHYPFCCCLACLFWGFNPFVYQKKKKKNMSRWRNEEKDSIWPMHSQLRQTSDAQCWALKQKISTNSKPA